MGFRRHVLRKLRTRISRLLGQLETQITGIAASLTRGRPF
jgi:hypothetical protein